MISYKEDERENEPQIQGCRFIGVRRKEWDQVWAPSVEEHLYQLLVKNGKEAGTWVAQWVKPPPSAQVMISGSWDRAPRWAPCLAGSLLPPLSLPVSLPTCDLSLSNK